MFRVAGVLSGRSVAGTGGLEKPDGVAPKLFLLQSCRCTLGLAFAVALLCLPAPAFATRGPDSLADEAAAVSDAVVNISATQTVEEKQVKNESDAPDMQQGTPFRRSL